MIENVLASWIPFAQLRHTQGERVGDGAISAEGKEGMARHCPAF